MTRYAGALACLLATASAASAMHIPASLRDVVNAETPRNPALRKKEAERKNLMQKQLASMAVHPEKLNGRKLNDNNNNQNNNQANYADYVWDEYMDEYALGFDITNYSIKYTQCATVQTYSDTLAEDEDSDTVLAAQRFAIFRLCPADVCSDTSDGGCASNYGEYIVSLDQFLLAMLEYQESRVAGYCEYCQDCAAIEASKSFWTQVYNTRDYALANAKSSYTVRISYQSFFYKIHRIASLNLHPFNFLASSGLVHCVPRELQFQPELQRRERRRSRRVRECQPKPKCG